MKMKLLGLLLFSLCVFFACQKRADQILTPKEKYQKEFADWLHSQKNSFSDEQLLVEKDKIARLNWGAANYFETEKTSFLEVPYAFQAAQNSQNTGISTNNSQAEVTTYSIVFSKSKQGNVTQARILIRDKINAIINSTYIKYIYFFDDLLGERKRYYHSSNGSNKLIRLYKGEDQQLQTQSINTLTNSCRSVLVKEKIYRCVGINISGNYDVTCGYETIGASLLTVCNGSSQTEVPDGFDYEGFGDGSGEDDPNRFDNPNQCIIDSLVGYPCAQSVLSATFNVQAELSKLIFDVFNQNEVVNLTFKPRILDDNLDGVLLNSMADSSYAGPGYAYLVIAINTKILSSATKEYLMATFMHEALHAYIQYQKLNMDPDTFNNTFPLFGEYKGNDPHHNLMAYMYFDKMEKLIKKYNSSLDDLTVKAIVAGGLYKTDYWTKLDAQTKNELINLNLAERNTNDTTTYGKYKGTKCD